MEGEREIEGGSDRGRGKSEQEEREGGREGGRRRRE